MTDKRKKMVTPEEMEKGLKELKNKIQEGKIVVGTDKVLQRLKDKSLSRIFLANNCPKKTKENINYYAQLSKISVIDLEMNNEELGLFCKKNFFIAALGTE